MKTQCKLKMIAKFGDSRGVQRERFCRERRLGRRESHAFRIRCIRGRQGEIYGPGSATFEAQHER